MLANILKNNCLNFIIIPLNICIHYNFPCFENVLIIIKKIKFNFINKLIVLFFFSLWFIHLPSHILQSEDRAASILRSAYELLNKFQKAGVHLLTDEVCS